MVDPTLFSDEPVVRILGTLVGLGKWALATLVLVGLMRLAVREYAAWKVPRALPPEDRREVRRTVRRMPLFGRNATAGPADPYLLTTPVVVQPLGDGRPGWSVMAPGPSHRPPGPPNPDGSRNDAIIPLERDTQMLVVCLGRVGAVARARDGTTWSIEPAEERARNFHGAPPATFEAVGPVDAAPTALGLGWRVTVTAGSRRLLTDTHLDKDGWAFVVGVLSMRWHARAVDALDAILATWCWLEPQPRRQVDVPPW